MQRLQEPVMSTCLQPAYFIFEYTLKILKKAVLRFYRKAAYDFYFALYHSKVTPYFKFS
jgi:hypothetical protein